MTIRRLSEREEGAWRGFLETHARVWREMERRLAKTGLSMTDYDCLVALEVAGEGGVRMTELAKRTTMSSGGFTRLADRLEGRGFIARRPCPSDGRGLLAVLTDEGRAALRRARAGHLDDVREIFLGPLSEEDQERLAEVWRRLGQGGGEPAGDGC